MQPSDAVKPSATPVSLSTSSPVRAPTLFVLAAASLVVRFLYLASKPFWFDECFSVEVARIGWSDFLRLLWWREANMSLYYLLLRMWLSVAGRHGQSLFFIRSLSVLISAATLPAIYWLARLLYDRRVAVIAATLFAFNAYNVRYAQEARSYALFLLLATMSSGFLIAFLQLPSRRHRLGYELFSILAVYAHFHALLLVVAQCLAVRWLGSRGLRTGLGTGLETETIDAQMSAQMRRAWITIGLAVLPLLVFVAKTGAGPLRWIQRPGLRDVVEFYQHLAGGSNWVLPAICAATCGAAVVPAGRALFARDQDWRTWTWRIWRVQFLLLWLFFPVVLTVLLSFARPVFLGRYMIFCLPALLILVAAGLARLRRMWLLVATLTGILLFSLQGISFVYGHDFDNERDASGAATNFILDHTQAGDAILFHIAGTRVAYEFFRSLRAGENTASPHFTAQFGPEILFPRHGAGLDYRDFTGKPTEGVLRSIGETHPRVWIMLMNNGSTVDPDPTTTMLTKVLPESFPKMQRWGFTKVEVRLYSK
jgi:mannosyltransferase